MQAAVFVINDGHGIVDGILSRPVEVLGRRHRIEGQIALHMHQPLAGKPGLPSVGAAAQHHVDGPPVAGIPLASFTIGQDGAACGDDDSGNAVQLVPAFTGNKQIGLQHLAGPRHRTGRR